MHTLYLYGAVWQITWNSTVDVVYAIGKKIAEYENKSLEEFSRYMNKPEKEAEQTKGERRG